MSNEILIGSSEAFPEVRAASTPEVPIEVDPESVTEVPEDPNVEYVRRSRDVLSRLSNMPMGSHETRMIKEALLTLFEPAIIEAEKHLPTSRESDD